MKLEEIILIYIILKILSTNFRANYEYIFIDSGLSIKDKIRLNFILKQFCNDMFFSKPKELSKDNVSFRNWNIEIQNSNKFENFLFNLIKSK